MRKVIWCLCALLIVSVLAVPPAGAQERTLPMGQEKSTLTLVRQGDDGLVYDVQVGDLTALDVQTPEGVFTRLILPDFHRSQREGSPELPMMNRLFEIPAGASVQIEVLGSSEREFDLAAYGITQPLFPAQPSMPKNVDPADWPFVYDRASYSQALVAQERAAVVDLGALRGARVGRLEISPVEYFPAENKIVVHDRMEVRVRFNGTDRSAEAQLKANTKSPFFDAIYTRLDGYRGLHDNYPDRVRDVVTMVIVTPAQFESQLTSFVAWKKLRGFQVIVGVLGTPEVGATKESVQAWLRNLYQNGNPQQPAPSFVLFVGDVDTMPTWLMSGDPTDRPYCAVDADLMPDMYYGRWSVANSTHLSNIIAKTMMYEQYTMPDPSYLGKACMIGGMDANYGQVYANGQINYGTTYYFNTAHGISSYIHLYPASGSQDAQIISEVSQGLAYVNYTAHGSESGWADPTFTSTDVNGLQNNGKYCLAVGNCCLTSHFDYGSECFAETWIRAGNKGAIGYIGAANYSYWDEDYWWGVGYRATIVEHPTFDPAHMGAYDGVFHDHGEPATKWYVTNDALVFCGNLAVTEAGSSLTTYYWNVYNLMGDPSLSAYLGVPSANNVSHPSSIMVGWTSLAVTAAPGSYVGLTKDGAVVGAGTVPESGSMDLPIWSTLTPGTAHLVVTMQNKIPYQVDIPVVAPSGPYLIIDGEVCDDNQNGDGDFLCDAGETINLFVVLKNVGVEMADNPVGILSTSDPYTTISVSTANFPDILPGESQMSSICYRVSFASNTPDNHQATFNLHVDCTGYSWDHPLTLIVGSPSLAYLSQDVDDAPPLGNGSGWIVPGESANLTLTLGNTGHANANDVVLTLTQVDPYIQILLGNATCADIPAAGQGVFSPLQIKVLEACPVPAVLSLQADVSDAYGYAGTVQFSIPVGGFADDVEANRGWTLGAPGDNAVSGLWVRDDPVGTTYNGSTVQPEDDHTPTPGTQCFVTGNGTPGGAAGEQDVDGGTTTLLSPVFDLSGVTGATVSYWFWYTNNLGNNPNLDYWDVQVTADGTTWVNLEHTTNSTNAWAQRTFDLQSYITLGTQVQLRFLASDTGTNSLVEALVDDFILTVVEPDPVAAPGAVLRREFALENRSPNPVMGAAELSFSVPGTSQVGVRLYDVGGSLVRTLYAGTARAGTYGLHWDGRNDSGRPAGSGVYFVRMQAPGFSEVKQIVLVR